MGDVEDMDEKMKEKLFAKYKENVCKLQIKFLEYVTTLKHIVPWEVMPIVNSKRVNEILTKKEKIVDQREDVSEEILMLNAKTSTNITRPFTIQKAELLNIVLLGKSGSGKSTLASTLLDVNHISIGHSLFSKTRDPELFSLVANYEEKLYQLNIIDSPGLFEATEIHGDQRTNKTILDLALACVDNSLTSVHCFAIVHRQDETLSEENLETFRQLYPILDDIKSNCYLIITHCEKLNKAKRNEKKN